MSDNMHDNPHHAVSKSFPGARPRAALILGSGWGEAADIFAVRGEISYRDIPGLGAATVHGHAGRLTWGDCAGVETLVFQGRRHWYENAGWEPVLLPVRICRQMGVEWIVLTNAAGGLRADLPPGALMVLSDHINAMGANPLAARLPEESGEFFTDQTAVYDPHLRATALEAAASEKMTAAPGIYLAVSGPSYETPAEVRMYRAWGADAVGMSTVPEAMLAHALGMRVLGISCITNPAAGLQSAKLSHGEVTGQAARSMSALRKILELIWRQTNR